MTTKIKAIAVAVCALLLVVCSVFGTFAYLTDTEAVKNTFTVGKIYIDLDEADVKTDGTANGNARDKANTYNLIPGHEYIKDPTVTVKAGSEACYVRVLVTINEQNELDAIFGEEGVAINTILTGTDTDKWKIVKETENNNNTRTYEIRYIGAGEKDEVPAIAKDAEDVKLSPVFTKLKVPGDITKEQLATIEDLEIEVVAHAIQAAGFATADLAWKEWPNN